jgi:hypothetical protein
VATESDQLRAEIEATRGDLASDLSTLGDRTSPKRIAARRWDSMKGTGRSIRHRVMGTASDTTGSIADKASTVATDVAGTVRQAPDMVTKQAQGSPLAAGIIAFGAGLLAAAVIPASETERRVGSQLAEGAQDVIEPVKQTAAELGQEVKDSATSAAAEVGQGVKESAARTGEQAKESGRTATEQLRS